jgi:type IV pilus assembly protein PilV
MHRKQQGFTLIEVLVSVLILSVGLLGIAGMQGLALTNNNNTYFRTTANLLATEIIDMARVLPDEHQATFKDAKTQSITWTKTRCDTTNCASTAMAQNALIDWKDQLEDWLPYGKGWVEVDGDNVMTVNIFWYERGDRGFLPNTFTTRADLRG